MKTQKIKLDTRIIEYDKDKNILKDYVEDRDAKSYENTIDIEINNSDGSIDKKIKMPFNSFVWGFLDTLNRKITGYEDTYTNNYHMTLLDVSKVNSTNMGIIVGSSSASYSVANTNLIALIPNTTLTYYLPSLSISNIGAITTLKISRTIKNQTASTVNIKEIGMKVAQQMGTDSTTYTRLIARDINDSLGVPINIDLLAGQSMIIKYNISVNANDGLLYNFLNALKCASYGDTMSLNNILGSTTTLNYYNTNGLKMHATNDTLYGVMPGSGTTPVTAMDYKLEAIIPNSPTGLTYNTTPNNSFATPITVGNTTSYILKKNFINNSIANITINEAGLYTYGNDGDNRICIARRIITPMVIVPTHTVDIIFTLSTTL